MSPGPHDSHGSGYANESWIGFGGYSQPPHHHHQNSHGANGYPGYDYQAPPIPMEPGFAVSRPPPYALAPQPQNHMPPPPIMYPSQLVSSGGSYPTPILPAITIPTPLSATSMSSDITPISAKSSTSRRKLTDEERRAMCIEAENNPTMKQTQIGAKFNVERSTVSKILRQKDKYMKTSPKEESSSSNRKFPKQRQPDVEKTLGNWVRNQKRQGITPDDEALRAQAHKFAANRDDQPDVTSDEWISSFKRKFMSSDSKPERGESTADSSRTQSETREDSPISSTGVFSPVSASEELSHTHFRHERSDSMFDFEISDSPLHHGFSPISAGSRAVISPLSPALTRDFTIHDTNTNTPTEANFSSLRGSMAPRLASVIDEKPPMPPPPLRSMSTFHEQPQKSVNPRQTMKRHKSVPDIHEADANQIKYSSMQPPPLPRSEDISPIMTRSLLSSNDEAINALQQITEYLKQRKDIADPEDYLFIGKLMEKLRQLQIPSPSTPMSSNIISIDRAISPRASKKRPIDD